MQKRKGYSMIELIVVLAIVAIVALVSMSFAEPIRRRMVVRAAAAELRSTLDQTRRFAIARNRSVGVKFRSTATGWTTQIYEDGDRDGVRNDDIVSGRDPSIRGPQPIFGSFGMVGLPPYPLTDPVSSRPLEGASPVRFGTSTICSFSPRGEATSGSIYMTDGIDTVVLRVYGGTGHIRLLQFNPATRRWRP